MHFCAEESCGKCTPCRIGAVRGVEVIDRIRVGAATGQDVEPHRALLDDLCTVMVSGSLCAMGQLTPMPVRSALCLADRRAAEGSAESTSADRAPSETKAVSR
jgi:formate dehydrogenase iron-sulfur subunit